MFIDPETQPEKWLEIWKALTAHLADTEPDEINEAEIGLYCKGYGYEGTDERGHCFTIREKSGKKQYIFIQNN